MSRNHEAEEVTSLNLNNLDVEQLEKRLEMAAAPLTHEIEEQPCCSGFDGGCWGYCD